MTDGRQFSHGSRVDDLDLSGVHLHGANLEGARLTDASLCGADISGDIEGSVGPPTSKDCAMRGRCSKACGLKLPSEPADSPMTSNCSEWTESGVLSRRSATSSSRPTAGFFELCS
jgi:hypothetical protein